MGCPVCSCEEAHRPATPCSMEMWTCKSCGHDYWLRIHDVFEPGPDTVISVLFTGKYALPHPQDATKAYLKMKRLLRGCERFSLGQLERQFIDKELVWELGYFIDEEVELLLPECEKLGLLIEFRVASYEDWDGRSVALHGD